jgi:hypothetical protein
MIPVATWTLMFPASFFVVSLLSLQRLKPEALIILNWPSDHLILHPLIHLISSLESACIGRLPSSLLANKIAHLFFVAPMAQVDHLMQ